MSQQIAQNDIANVVSQALVAAFQRRRADIMIKTREKLSFGEAYSASLAVCHMSPELFITEESPEIEESRLCEIKDFFRNHPAHRSRFERMIGKPDGEKYLAGYFHLAIRG